MAWTQVPARISEPTRASSSTYLVSTTSTAPNVGTIETAVSWANQNTNANPAALAKPVPNTIVFDQTGVFATPQTITISGGPLAFTDTNMAEAVLGPVTGSVTLSGGNSVGVFTVASGVSATFTGLTISGGSASRGGAIDSFGNVSLVNDTLSGNSAATGGAIANESGGTLSILDSTLSSNTASANGGAIANAGGQMTVTNTTIANNTAPLGAGISNTGTLNLINVTVAYNNASQAGGGLDAASGTATLFNSIFAQNKAGADVNDINHLVSPTSAHNLIDDAGSAGGLTNSVNGNQIGVSAGLAAGLGNNGGSTETIALLASSPAIKAGAAAIGGVTVPTTDQRGAQRNLTGQIDLGAFEGSSSYIVTNTGDSLVAGTLRSAVAWANNNPASAASGPNTILFDPSVFGTPQTINLSDAAPARSRSRTRAFPCRSWVPARAYLPSRVTTALACSRFRQT